VVNLDLFIITVFCWIDDTLKAAFREQPLRQRGPMPTLSDAEVLTMEVVGAYLGFSQDLALYQYFRHHYTHFFPALERVHRTTFTRQASNLWKVKELVWHRLLDWVQYDPAFALVDSFPCRWFQEEAAFGKDTLVRQTFYGFRVHVRWCWPEVITRFAVAPANVPETAVVPELVAGTQGLAVGDRNYWSPTLKAELAQGGLQLEAPFRKASSDPWPKRSALLSRVRYRIDTTFGQLVDRYQIKRVWAKDSWHLHSRLLRKVLSHTLAVLLNQAQGNPSMQLARLIA
jgi:hypothetical protein